MKRKISFALVTISALGGAWSCMGGLNSNSGGENVLARQVAVLAKQLKSVEGVDKESVAQKLKAAVSEQFDFRHNGKATELEALEQQLAKLKEIHNKRTQQRDRIITDRVQQILLEVESLGWSVSDGSESQSRYTTSAGRVVLDGILPNCQEST